MILIKCKHKIFVIQLKLKDFNFKTKKQNSNSKWRREEMGAFLVDFQSKYEIMNCNKCFCFGWPKSIKLTWWMKWIHKKNTHNNFMWEKTSFSSAIFFYENEWKQKKTGEHLTLKWCEKNKQQINK